MEANEGTRKFREALLKRDGEVIRSLAKSIYPKLGTAITLLDNKYVGADVTCVFDAKISKAIHSSLFEDSQTGMDNVELIMTHPLCLQELSAMDTDDIDEMNIAGHMILAFAILYGYTPIHLSSMIGMSNMCDYVKSVPKPPVTQEYLVNVLSRQDKDGLTPLHIAVLTEKSNKLRSEIPDTISLLGMLDNHHRLQLLRMQDGSGQTILHNVARDSQMVHGILRLVRNEDWLELLKLQDCQGQTLLHIGGAEGLLTLFSSCQNKLGSNILGSLLIIKDKSGNTSLHNSLANGHTALVEMIMMVSFYPTQTLVSALQIANNSGYSPLHWALGRNTHNPENISKLIEYIPSDKLVEVLRQQMPATIIFGRHIDHMGDTMLHTIIVRKESELYLKPLLLSLNAADLEILLSIQNEANETPLHFAVRKSTVFKVFFPFLTKLLTAVQGDRKPLLTLLGMKNKMGETVIHKATECELTAILELLPEPDITSLLGVRNSHGETAFHEAVRNSRADLFIKIFSVIQRKAVSPLMWLQDHNGATPLHTAIYHRDVALVNFVLEQVDIDERLNFINVADQDGNTALHLAVELRSPELLSTMLTTLNDSDRQQLSRIENKDGNRIQELAAEDLGHWWRCIQILSGQKENEKKNLIPHFAEGTKLLHRLAARGQLPEIKLLLSEVSERQKRSLLVQTDESNRTVYQVATTENVRQFLDWTDATLQEDLYYLPTPPVVLVMYTTADRPGADDELEELSKTIRKFNLRGSLQGDLTREGMLAAIRRQQESHPELSALIVIIMSHGQRGAVQAKDKPVSINDILMQMNSGYLNGKPKVLLIQACQNENREEGGGDVVPQAGLQKEIAEDEDAKNSESIDPHFDVKYSDTMVLMATVNGSRAKRNMMIPLFAKHLRNSQKYDDLYDVFRKTNRDIQLEETEQTAEFRSTMTHKLCLHTTHEHIDLDLHSPSHDTTIDPVSYNPAHFAAPQ